MQEIYQINRIVSTTYDTFFFSDDTILFLHGSGSVNISLTRFLKWGSSSSCTIKVTTNSWQKINTTWDHLAIESHKPRLPSTCWCSDPWDGFRYYIHQLLIYIKLACTPQLMEAAGASYERYSQSINWWPNKPRSNVTSLWTLTCSAKREKEICTDCGATSYSKCRPIVPMF